MGANVSDWQLEQFLAGELDAAAAANVTSALERAGEVGRLEALRASNAEILQAHPPSRVADEVRRRAERERTPAPSWRMWAPGMAGAALAVMVAIALRPPPSGDSPGEQPDTVRFKGDPQLLVYRKSGNESNLLGNGASGRRGDLIQLKYGPSHARYGVVVSVDGRGNATLHFPASAADSTALSGSGAALPHAYELDDAPVFERFFLVTSSAPIEVQAVLESARALGKAPSAVESERLALPDSLHQSSFLLRKASP
jgi:hypothetical protein